MFINEEEQAEQSVGEIFDPKELVQYHKNVSQIYDQIARILILTRHRPGSETFEKVIDVLVENLPYLRPLQGPVRIMGPTQMQEQTTYPPEAIAFFRQVFGEKDWDRMPPEEQRKQVEKLTKLYKDGSVKLTAGPGDLRIKRATADQEKIYKTLRNYKKDYVKYLKYIADQFERLVKTQYGRLGYEYMIKENPDLEERVKSIPKQDFEDKFDTTIKGILGNKSNFDQQTLKNYTDMLINGVSTEMEKVKLREQYEFVFDLNILKEQKQMLNEGFFDMFGAWVKFILKTVLGDFSIPVSIKGNPREVESFARAIQGEKKYIDAIGKYGLNNKTTYNSRAELARSIKGFERETGLSWPFN